MLNTSTDIIGSEQQEGKRTVAGGGAAFLASLLGSSNLSLTTRTLSSMRVEGLVSTGKQVWPRGAGQGCRLG